MSQFVIRAQSQEGIKEVEFFVLFSQSSCRNSHCLQAVRLQCKTDSCMVSSYGCFLLTHSFSLLSPNLAFGSFHSIFRMLKPTNASSTSWLNLLCYHSFKDFPQPVFFSRVSISISFPTTFYFQNWGVSKCQDILKSVL